MQKIIEEYIDSHRDEIIQKWRELVEIEAFWSETEYTREVAAYVKKLFEDAGCECEIVDPDPSIPTPPVVTGVIGKDRPGTPILFGGHYDTVFKRGFLKDHPFRIDENGHAYGPGVLDMKGGIVIAAYVIKALEAAGYNERPIRISFCGDEEGGSNHGKVADVLAESGRGCEYAFNMETGIPKNNAICVGRKGAAAGKFIVHGVAAHSGNAFEAGRNAVIEAAHKMLAIDALTNMETGTHMNVAMVKGGLVPNQVPDVCEVTWMCRFRYNEEMEKTIKAVDEILAKTYIEGTTTENIQLGGGKVFEDTPENNALVDFIDKISQQYGYGSVGRIFLGGGSDAPNFARYGAITICACGVLGEWNHTDREYAIVESMFTRAKMWGAVVTHLSEHKH
ncbi:MAG: M20/M25/M40 family metallo-hydrolase [Solobacterium sp.]|nr:M20/M25/M40 family metallo-hydrolase [Solobacterium sp.]